MSKKRNLIRARFEAENNSVLSVLVGFFILLVLVLPYIDKTSSIFSKGISGNAAAQPPAGDDAPSGGGSSDADTSSAEGAIITPPKVLEIKASDAGKVVDASQTTLGIKLKQEAIAFTVTPKKSLTPSKKTTLAGVPQQLQPQQPLVQQEAPPKTGQVSFQKEGMTVTVYDVPMAVVYTMGAIAVGDKAVYLAVEDSQRYAAFIQPGIFDITRRPATIAIQRKTAGDVGEICILSSKVDFYRFADSDKCNSVDISRKSSAKVFSTKKFSYKIEKLRDGASFLITLPNGLPPGLGIEITPTPKTSAP